MVDRARRAVRALSRDLSSVRGDWRLFATGMAAETAFVLLLASVALLSVEIITWMGQ